jgi:hypothetical protein
MSANSPTAYALLNGGYFDPYADPVDHRGITIDAIAVGLERTNRFRCQTRRPISVAEHLLRQTKFARAIMIDTALAAGFDRLDFDGVGLVDVLGYEPAQLELWSLLDDAHEGLTPWGDVPTPCKTDWMREVEGRIDVAIAKALQLGSCPPLVRQ